MKLTASNKFNQFALAASKELQWKAYARKTLTLNDALNAGAWTDVTPYISTIPDLKASVEYSLGEYKADKITLGAKDVAWWRKNIFNNATAVVLNGSSEYAYKTTPSNLDLNGAELITTQTNRDAETTVGDWKSFGNHVLTRSTTDKKSGTASIKIAASGIGNGITNYGSLPNYAFSLEVGKQYTLEFWARMSTAQLLSYSIGGQASTKSGVSTVSGTFTKVVFNFTATTNEELRVYLGAAADCYIDDISITEAYDATMSCWFKKSTDSGVFSVVFGYNSNTVYEMRVRDDSNNNIDFVVSDGTTSVQLADAVNIIDGSWKLATASLTRQGNCVLYVNGVSIASGSMASVGKIKSTGNFAIGRRASGATNYFNGEVGEVQILRGYACTAIQAGAMYRDGIPQQWGTGTIVASYQWHGDNAIQFLRDESSSHNDLNGSAIGQVNDETFGDYYATYPTVDQTYSGIYLEFKIEFMLTGATDVIYEFCGYVERNQGGIKLNESDNVEIPIYTVEVLGDTKSAEKVCVSIQDANVDGASTAGLILPTITNVYVTDANLSGYVLTEGVHKISYDYNGGTPQMKLDNGAWISVTASAFNTLGNVDNTTNDTARVKVYCKSPLITIDGLYEDTIIVTTAGDTIPKRWYRDTSTRTLLTELYKQIGLTSLTYGTLEWKTWDGLNRYSFIDTPPNTDNAHSGSTKLAICADSNNLYIAVGGDVYSRNFNDGTYTYLFSSVAGNIQKLMYNSRNGHLWAMTDEAHLFRYVISTGSRSAEIELSGADSNLARNSIMVFDYDYTGAGAYKYGVVWTDINSDVNGGRLRFCDGTSLTVTDIDTGTGLAASTHVLSFFMYEVTAGTVRFRQTNAYRDYAVNGSGTWVKGSAVLTGISDYTEAVYNSAEGLVYYFDDAGDKVATHSNTSTTATTVVSLGSSDEANCFHYANNRAYFIAATKLYSAVTSVATMLDTTAIIYNDVVFANSRLYLLYSDLYQFYNYIVPNVPIADFTGMSVTQAINQILSGFQYVATISFAKKATVYARGDSNGVPQTSGNYISVDVSNSSDLVQEINYSQRAFSVKVSNATDSISYDGKVFYSTSLSDKYNVEVSNTFIPTAILKDVAYNVFQFFKVDRTLYRVTCGIVPLFQYEIFDGCSLTFTSNKVIKTAYGVIYSTLHKQNGSMILEVLV